MATTKTKEAYEGHGEDSKAPSVRKGEFQQVGTTVELSQRGTSVNQKTGNSGGGES